MVFDIAGFFSPKGRKRRPLINQIPTSVVNQPSNLSFTTGLQAKQKFWDWFRTRPELNGPVQIRVDDTIGNVEFLKPDGTPLGRNKRIQAERFWAQNFMYERLKSLQYDRLITGDGYLWLGRPLVNEKTMKTLKGKVESVVTKQKLPINVKSEVATRLFLKAIDEDLRIPRIIDYIPASTVVIEHDRYEVLRYVQWFLAQQEVFMPEEVVHIPLSRVDGKVEGFTPLESLYYELVLLWAIKENMLAFFRNGGVPKKMFILPEEMSESENHRWLTQLLMDRGAVQNRHGNLVLTGKVEVEDLEMKPQDLEYKDLSLWVASNIAYAFRVPISRIPYLIGKAQSSNDSSGLAESGYWHMIESDQRTVESHLNTQIFIPNFGYMVKFKKKYKLDDLREAQSLDIKADAVSKMQTALGTFGKQLNETAVARILDVSLDELQDAPEPIMEEGGVAMNHGRAQDGQVVKEPGQQNKDAAKRTSAQNNVSDSAQRGR